ncbi:hypothetical protein Skr01_47050 [Sphaerisporangium krabiense]|nr:hypothetical protein Skr01_47050 [Sphaerisporangium krabiense]
MIATSLQPRKRPQAIGIAASRAANGTATKMTSSTRSKFDLGSGSRSGRGGGGVARSSTTVMGYLTCSEVRTIWSYVTVTYGIVS